MDDGGPAYSTDYFLDVVRVDNTPTALWLLEKNVGITAQSSYDLRTPLHCAAYNGNNTIIKKLLEKGASTTEKDCNGFTPIESAASNNQWKSVILIANVRKSIYGDHYGAALRDAVRYNQIQAAFALLEAGAEINWCTKSDRRSTLHWAGIIKNQTLTEALVAGGVNITARDNNGELPCLDPDFLGTLLLQAAKENQTARIPELLTHVVTTTHASPDTKYTAMHWAVINNNIIVLNYLIRYKANTNVEDYLGRTPLGILFVRRQFEMLVLQVDLPVPLLQLVNDYCEPSITDETFIFTEYKISCCILKNLEGKLPSVVQTFQAELSAEQEALLLTLPQLTRKLLLFLSNNPELMRLSCIPLDSFISTVAENINLENCLVIKRYMEARQSLIPVLISHFKNLYITLKKELPIYAKKITRKNFLTEKEYLEANSFLKTIQMRIVTNPNGHTALCWELVCKYNNVERQLIQLREIIAKSRFNFRAQTKFKELRLLFFNRNQAGKQNESGLRILAETATAHVTPIPYQFYQPACDDKRVAQANNMEHQ